LRVSRSAAFGTAAISMVAAGRTVTHRNVTMVTGATCDQRSVIRRGLTVVFLFACGWMNWRLTLVMLLSMPVIALTAAQAKSYKQSKEIRSGDGRRCHPYLPRKPSRAHRVVQFGSGYESSGLQPPVRTTPVSNCVY
jgi:hypothetical protein